MIVVSSDKNSPDPVHLISLIARIYNWCIFISLTVCASMPVLNADCCSHIPRSNLRVISLAVGIPGIRVLASSRLSLGLFIDKPRGAQHCHMDCDPRLGFFPLTWDNFGTLVILWSVQSAGFSRAEWLALRPTPPRGLMVFCRGVPSLRSVSDWLQRQLSAFAHSVLSVTRGVPRGGAQLAKVTQLRKMNIRNSLAILSLRLSYAS